MSFVSICTIDHHYRIDLSFPQDGIIAPENSPWSSVSEYVSESVSEIDSETDAWETVTELALVSLALVNSNLTGKFPHAILNWLAKNHCQ